MGVSSSCIWGRISEDGAGLEQSKSVLSKQAKLYRNSKSEWRLVLVFVYCILYGEGGIVIDIEWLVVATLVSGTYSRL